MAQGQPGSDYPVGVPPAPLYGDTDQPDRRPACVDHPTLDRDAWFPVIRGNQGWDLAKAAARVCRDECPVNVLCGLLAAELRPVGGVWNGTLWVSDRVGKRPPSENDARPSSDYYGRPSLRNLYPDALQPENGPLHSPPSASVEDGELT